MARIPPKNSQLAIEITDIETVLIIETDRIKEEYLKIIEIIERIKKINEEEVMKLNDM